MVKCDNCSATNSKGTYLLMGYGDLRYSKGELVCQTCFDSIKSQQELIHIPNQGIPNKTYYTKNWIYSYKNPHGHRIFDDLSEKELEETTDEDKKVIDETIEKYCKKLQEEYDKKKQERAKKLKETPKSTEKKSNKPAANGYVLYLQEKKEEGILFEDAAQNWKTLTKEEQKIWSERAKKMKTEYYKEHPEEKNVKKKRKYNYDE